MTTFKAHGGSATVKNMQNRKNTGCHLQQPVCRALHLSRCTLISGDTVTLRQMCHRTLEIRAGFFNGRHLKQIQSTKISTEQSWWRRGSSSLEYIRPLSHWQVSFLHCKDVKVSNLTLNVTCAETVCHFGSNRLNDRNRNRIFRHIHFDTVNIVIL